MSQSQPPIAYRAFVMTDVDRSHLKILSICYWIWGALLLLISLVSLIYIGLGVAFLNGSMNSTTRPGTAPPPPEVGWFFIILGLVVLLFGQVTGWLNILVGFSLKNQRRWLLCNVVAGLNCISIPFGTLLGIFSFVVLGRPAVKQQFN